MGKRKEKNQSKDGPSSSVKVESDQELQQTEQKQSQSTSAESNPAMIPQVATKDQLGGVQLSQFWKNRPKLWFIQLECQFVAYGVRSDDAKLGVVLRHLDEESVFSIADELEQLPQSNKYEHIKTALIQKFPKCPEFTKQVAEIELGDKNPSMLLQEMRILAESNVTDDVLRKLWLQKLDKRMQELLEVVEDSMTLDKLAELADMVLAQMLVTGETNCQKDADTIKSLTKQVHDLIESMSNINAATNIKSATILELAGQLTKSKDQIDKDAKTIEELRKQVQELMKAEPGSIDDLRFTRVHLNVLGPFESDDNYTHCLIMVDLFTRWVEAVPIFDGKATTVARAFIATWVSRFGVPTIIATEQDTQFKGKLFDRLTNLLGCIMAEPSLELNEFRDKWHYTLENTLRHELQDTDDWVNTLPIILLGLRTAYRPELQCSPFAKVYNKNLKLPCEFFKDTDEPHETESSIIKDLRDTMHDIRPRSTTNCLTTRPIFVQKQLHEATHVFVRSNPIEDSALLPPYDGPFKVLERSRDNYIMLSVHGKPCNYPVDKVQPAFEENLIMPMNGQ